MKVVFSVRGLVAIAILSAPLLCRGQGTMSIVAGTGNPPLNGVSIGDGGPAIRAFLDDANAVAVDPSGNLFIWEGTAYRIRKVNPAGIISTVAGNGSNGSSGDGGLATSAQLGLNASGGGLGADSAGNLYIAGFLNNRVRKVDTSGRISTVAGNGATAIPGTPSGDGQAATSVPLCTPSSVAADRPGNLYIGSSICITVRKVDTSGIITTVAGGGGFGFSGDGGPATKAAISPPIAITVDSVGNLYFADGLLASRVRKVNTDGIISTIAGSGTRGLSGDGGPAVNAQLSDVVALAVDGAGNVFISDFGNKRIRKVDPSGTITTAVGGGTGPLPNVVQNSVPAGNVRQIVAFDLAVDTSGNLYAASSQFVYKITGIASSGPPPAPPAPPTASVTKTVSAAGLQSGPVAPESIVIATGSHLATGSATADRDSPGTTLAGTTVKVTDANGSSLLALVMSVSPTQVTYQIPAGMAVGAATVTITAADGVSATAPLQIAAVAPGLYTLNSSGLVKAYAVRISNGNTFIEDVFEVDATGAVIARPITISNGDQVYLIVYGTGFRAAGGDISVTVGGIGAPILYAGPQGVQPGLDQFTIVVPPELATGGPQVVQIVLTAGGQTANAGNVMVQ